MSNSDINTSAAFARQDARKQFQTQGERAKRDAGAYNASLSLLMRDEQARELLMSYAQANAAGRAEILRAASAAIAGGT